MLPTGRAAAETSKRRRSIASEKSVLVIMPTKEGLAPLFRETTVPPVG
jgi:hypothetical protein